MQNIPYFQHDNDMRNDPKIIALRNKYGLTGYAVYCLTLETLTYKKELALDLSGLGLELLAGDFRIESSLLEEIYGYCFKLNLLQLSENNFLLCEELVNRLTPLLEKREKWREKWYSRKKNANSPEKTENSPESIENSKGAGFKGKDKGKGKGKDKVRECLNSETHATTEPVNDPINIPDDVHIIWRKAFDRNCNFNEYEFTTKCINLAGKEEAERHIREMSKKGFKILATMEQATESAQEIQTDGTVKTVLKIKPKDVNNGNTATSNKQNSYYSRASFTNDPEQLREVHEYIKSFGDDLS